ncbi:unnamed protein product [Paramecium sonneborni]|uniref:Uncharacterized protein n=1 Tax=Paramecium sonneborni TaxID=65129 RepID=A0A8S1NQ93_9CILI|nr:unnamed protein product [Paramecium sonneborni]
MVIQKCFGENNSSFQARQHSLSVNSSHKTLDDFNKSLKSQGEMFFTQFASIFIETLNHWHSIPNKYITFFIPQSHSPPRLRSIKF